MLCGCVWTALLGLLFFFSMPNQNEALSPFQLTYAPSHVVKHFTELVTVRCAHEDGNGASQLQQVSRIRLLKKSSSGWQLLAEIRDNENKPKAYVNVSVSARISSYIPDNFIEIVWPVATDATIGIYRCDFIGFDQMNFQNKAELTPLVMLLEEGVTTVDMINMFLETKDELQHMEEDTKHLEHNVGGLRNKLAITSREVNQHGADVSRLENDMSTVRQSLNLVKSDAALLKGSVASLKLESNLVIENTNGINSLNVSIKSVKDKVNSMSSLRSWPAGKFALLQPKTGCPVDLTFFGGSGKYWQIHTEPRSRFTSSNAHTDVLSPKTLSTNNGNNFFTLNFCEANGVLNSASWPEGSYCINRLLDIPCPSGFSEGYLRFGVEDTGLVTEFTSRSVENGHRLLFCCTTSGHYSTPIDLPAHSPFLLYRRGGQCQWVTGMAVSEETITIDTEDYRNVDSRNGVYPDVVLRFWSTTIKIYLCHYTPT